MSQHLYLFDVDGTLIKSFLRQVRCPGGCEGSGWMPGLVKCEVCRGTGFKLVHSEVTYDDIEWLPERLELLEKLRDAGHPIGLVTNQTGVSLGYQTLEQVERKLSTIVRTIRLIPAPILSAGLVYAWAEYDVRATNRRKPAPKMLHEAMVTYGVQPWQTTFVGDLPVDEEAARAAHVAFSWADDFFDTRAST